MKKIEITSPEYIGDWKVLYADTFTGRAMRDRPLSMFGAICLPIYQSLDGSDFSNHILDIPGIKRVSSLSRTRSLDSVNNFAICGEVSRDLFNYIEFNLVTQDDIHIISKYGDWAIVYNQADSIMLFAGCQNIINDVVSRTYSVDEYFDRFIKDSSHLVPIYSSTDFVRDVISSCRAS